MHDPLEFSRAELLPLRDSVKMSRRDWLVLFPPRSSTSVAIAIEKSHLRSPTFASNFSSRTRFLLYLTLPRGKDEVEECLTVGNSNVKGTDT